MVECGEFVQRVGLKTALEMLGEQVWDKAKLTFEQWDHERRMHNYDPEFQQKILVKMAQVASFRDQWLMVWAVAPAKSPLCLLAMEKIKEMLEALGTFDEVRAWPSKSQLLLGFDLDGEWAEVSTVWLQRMAKLAESMEHWQTIFSLTCMLNLGSDLRAQALAKKEQYAKTFEDWRTIYHDASHGSPARKRAVSNMARLAQDHEWSTVWHLAEKDYDDLAKSALLGAIASASTFDDWFSILAHSKEDKAIRELCINKLLGLAKTFANWMSIYQGSDGQIKDNALDQLLAMADTLDRWLSVWRWTPEGSAVKAQALKKVSGFVKLD